MSDDKSLFLVTGWLAPVLFNGTPAFKGKPVELRGNLGGTVSVSGFISFSGTEITLCSSCADENNQIVFTHMISGGEPWHGVGIWSDTGELLYGIETGITWAGASVTVRPVYRNS